MNALDGLNAVTLIFVALCVFAIGYRFYGVFIANKVLRLDEGRPMPAVTQADGTAYVFSSIPFLENLMAYWYHFATMFESVFILKAVDAGTKVGRFLLQEMFGKVVPKFAQTHWVPGILISGVIFKRWDELLNIKTDIIDKWGEKVRATIPDEDLTLAEGETIKRSLVQEMAQAM